MFKGFSFKGWRSIHKLVELVLCMNKISLPGEYTFDDSVFVQIFVCFLSYLEFSF
jgi:hypothetical protein